MHDINCRTWGGNVVLKLYMAKAQDKMSWSFILQMFHCFGFLNISVFDQASNLWALDFCPHY